MGVIGAKIVCCLSAFKEYGNDGGGNFFIGTFTIQLKRRSSVVVEPQ